MDRNELIRFLEKIDSNLPSSVEIYIYGSCAQMLLGEELRTSLDIDVAGPYCSGRVLEFRKAAEAAGLPIDPDPSFRGNHIEWVGPLRLALPKPDPTSDMVLWQGDHLTVRSVSPAHLIASKLIRYDESDMADIRFIVENAGVSYSDILESVKNLPARFGKDPVLIDNLENLKLDMQIWREESGNS